MKSIADFFSRIQGIQTKKIFLYAVTKEAINEHAKIAVPIESISFSGKTIVIKNLDQAAKSSIYIKKTRILDEIRKKADKIIVTDIRT